MPFAFHAGLLYALPLEKVAADVRRRICIKCYLSASSRRRIPKNLQTMSQHRSLRAASTSGAKRNVLKRFERVELLKKRGLWKSGERVTGLRKTKPEA